MGTKARKGGLQGRVSSTFPPGHGHMAGTSATLRGVYCAVREFQVIPH